MTPLTVRQERDTLLLWTDLVRSSEEPRVAYDQQPI